MYAQKDANTRRSTARWATCAWMPVGPVADALNLNAGVALAAAQIAPDPAAGVAMAQEAQRAGKAGAVLQRWVATSQREAAAEATEHS